MRGFFRDTFGKMMNWQGQPRVESFLEKPKRRPYFIEEDGTIRLLMMVMNGSKLLRGGFKKIGDETVDASKNYVVMFDSLQNPRQIAEL